MVHEGSPNRESEKSRDVDETLVINFMLGPMVNAVFSIFRRARKEFGNLVGFLRAVPVGRSVRRLGAGGVFGWAGV